jgi:hypothetical protein
MSSLLISFACMHCSPSFLHGRVDFLLLKRRTRAPNAGRVIRRWMLCVASATDSSGVAPHVGGHGRTQFFLFSFLSFIYSFLSFISFPFSIFLFLFCFFFLFFYFLFLVLYLFLFSIFIFCFFYIYSFFAPLFFYFPLLLFFSIHFIFSFFSFLFIYLLFFVSLISFMFVIFLILYDISLLHICSSSVNICSSIIGSYSDNCSYLFWHFILFLYFHFYILSFWIFFPPLIFLLFEMGCKFVLARIISCSGYKYLVRAIITICSDACSDLFWHCICFCSRWHICSDDNMILL